MTNAACEEIRRGRDSLSGRGRAADCLHARLGDGAGQRLLRRGRGSVSSAGPARMLLTRFPSRCRPTFQRGCGTSLTSRSARSCRVRRRWCITAASAPRPGACGRGAAAWSCRWPTISRTTPRDCADWEWRVALEGAVPRAGRRRGAGELLGSQDVKEKCRSIAARLKDNRAIEQTCEALEDLSGQRRFCEAYCQDGKSCQGANRGR